MNRTIPCLLLTLCLLLSAAAMADSDPDNYKFNICDGSITIGDGSISGTLKVQYGTGEVDNILPANLPEAGIYVGGDGTPHNSPLLTINAKVPVKITYAVSVDNIQQSAIRIADNADVTLIMDKNPCDAFGTNKQAGITLGSGSRLTIEAANTDNIRIRIYGEQNAIIGPSSDQTPATVILNSGTVHIHSQSGSGISGNVNLVINGGTFKTNSTAINAQNLIITGGELWAGGNNGTKVTYDNLSSYTNIKCAAGILPYREDVYEYLFVLNDLILPVDLTLPYENPLSLQNPNSLTIPAGRSLTCNGYVYIATDTPLTNKGTLTFNEHVELYVELKNEGTLIINRDFLRQNGPYLGSLTNTGTIKGSGDIVPNLPQNPPASLKIKSIENGTVTLAEVEAGITDAEYCLDDMNWGENRVFTNVDLSEGHTFTTRYKGDGHFYAESDLASVSIYPVSLDANGGTIAIGKDVGYYITNQSTPLPTKDDVTRENYSFAGWYANESCTGSPVTVIDAKASGAREYWAKWTAKTYMVKLHPNGGTIIGDDLTGYTYGVGATLPDADRTGYVFAGWFESAALTGSPVVAISETSTDDREFWAGWIARPVITSPTENRTVTVYEGEPATMTITAENAVAYQWFMSTDGGNSWTACGENSPAYTTSPTKMEHSGYQYMCVVTGSPEPKGAEDKEELPPEELPPEGAQMSLRSRATDDGLTGPMEESPIFTLEVIRKDAIPQTGDSSRMGLWLTLAGGCVLALACIGLRRGKRA